MPIYNGVLHLYSETGTEGGYWAFQDSQYIGIPEPDMLVCSRCHTWWDKGRDNEPRPVSFTYWRTDGPYGPGYFRSDTYDPNGDLGPTVGNRAYTRSANDRALRCVDGHGEFQLAYPNGRWDSEGMHILRDGDHITIYQPGRRDHDIAWDGPVSLTPHEPFTQSTFGFWIHADQNGIDRDQWGRMFLEGWPARLTTN